MNNDYDIKICIKSGLCVYSEIWTGKESNLNKRLEELCEDGYLLDHIYYPKSWQKYAHVTEL